MIDNEQIGPPLTAVVGREDPSSMKRPFANLTSDSGVEALEICARQVQLEGLDLVRILRIRSSRETSSVAVRAMRMMSGLQGRDEHLVVTKTWLQPGSN